MPEENQSPFRNTAFLLCVLSFFLFSYQIEQISLYHTDEQYYIQSCRNMVDSGDWLTPVMNEKMRFAKPILFYWLASLSFKMFGVSLASARLVSALLGSLGLWVVYRMGVVLFCARTGLYSVFILASSFLYFLSARLAYTDMTLSFFITLSLFFFSRLIGAEKKGTEGEKSRGRDILFFYLFMGLGTATKGPPGFMAPGLIIAAFLLATRDRKMAAYLAHPTGIFLFLCISLFWPLAMGWMHGESFAHHLLYAEGVDRVFHAERPSLYFLIAILRYFAPWSFFLVPAAFLAFGKEERHLFKTIEKRQLFLWLYIAVPLVLFTFLRTRHSRYMLPTFPALALLLGHYFHRITLREIDPQGRGFEIPFFFSAGLFLTLSALTLFAGFLLYYLEWELFSWTFFLLPLFFFLGGAALIFSWKKKDFSLSPLFISLTLLACFTLVAGKVIPSLNPDPMMAFAERINHEWKPGTAIGTYRFGNGNQRLRILTGRPVESIDKEEALSVFIKGDGPLFLAIREEDFKNMHMDPGSTFQISAEARQWIKIKFNSGVIDQIKREFGPGLLERFRERVFLVFIAN
jgi:4-amino-4-deoxy-L-arabinose transferase-like glycosyltransferase